MATVDGYTTAHVDAIEDQLIVSGAVDGSGHLILTLSGGGTIDLGSILSATPDASTTVKGLVELADGTETGDLSDTTIAVTPGGLGPVISAINTALSGKEDANAALASIAALTPAANDVLLYLSGAWANRTLPQLKTAMSFVKADVGLDNVDNTTDANKPVSTAQATAIAKKPDNYKYSGSAYAQVSTGAAIYVGTADPASTLTVVDGSVWFDTTP